MKIYVILGLCFAVVLGEKKINLDDIERDNLQAEGKSNGENVQQEETKYFVRPEGNQNQYQAQSNQYQTQENQYQALSNQIQSKNNQAAALIATQQSRASKYPVQSEDYSQGVKYVTNEIPYQQQYAPQPAAPQQGLQQPQYYQSYQQQAEIPQKSSFPAVHESQQAPQQYVYTPEVLVGNQLQSIQQKIAANKYVNKDALFVNIPANQLLSYYPSLGVNQVPSTKNQVHPLLYQFATQAAQKVSVPIYTPALSQHQLSVSPKFTYQTSPQISYASRYPQQTQATFTTKAPQNLAYTIPVTSKTSPSTQAYVNSVYSQANQAYSQPNKFDYTQAYFTQPQTQPQYVQLVYTPVYNSAYAHGTAYVQDNSPAYNQADQYGQQYDQQYTQPQQFYVPSSVADQLKKQILEQQQGSPAQNYIKVPEVPRTNFAPPQLPAQGFKTGTNQLVSVSVGKEENHHLVSSGPKSLLDSYTPSHIIAAQDIARYKERPIKLEGGFLPSKESLIQYKNTKSE